MRVVLLLLALADPSAAACPAGEEVFSCLIGTRALTSCHADGALPYRFGPEGQPELALTEPLATVDYAPYSGFGRSRFYSVTFRNGTASHEVWSRYDRIGDGAPMSGGVTLRDGTSEARLTCTPGTVTRELEGLGFLKVDLGQCYDWDLQSWRTGACGPNPELCSC